MLQRSLAWKAALLGIVLGISACGTRSDSSVGPVSPNSTQVPPSVASRDVAGIWAGNFPGKTLDGVFLRLEQSGNRLDGTGAIFRNDDPELVEVSGSINTDGLAVIDLVEQDDDQIVEDARLTLRFSGDRGSGDYQDDANPAGLAMQMSRRPVETVATRESVSQRLWDNSFTAFQAINPAEVYRIQGTCNGVLFSFEVKISATALYEFIGSWTSLDPEIKIANTWGNGRIAAANNFWGDWSFIMLKDPSSVFDIGEIWFRRFRNGQTGSTPTDASHLNTSSGNVGFNGSVTLVSP